MRRAFLILMIFLLPLRGLVGDAMAVQMMAPASSGESLAGNPSSKVGALGLEKLSAAPCHEVASSESGAAGHDACASCEVCHLSAFVTALSPASVLISAEAKPASPVVQLISAELVLFAKPPIL